ncbi:MAG TPA: hypothetical protein VGQ38_19625 [Gaiellaceae bacterium]|nr:hypothetical protein [Gaiellaceae bacterium]
MRVVVALVLLAIVISATAITTAAFTASSTNTARLVMGDIVFDVVPPGQIVDTTALKPGADRSGTVTITNRYVPASFSVGFAGIGTSALASTLQLTVTQTAPVSRQLYSGALAGVGSLSLGKLTQGQSAQLSIRFLWPAANADAELQGQSVPLVINWNATT